MMNLHIKFILQDDDFNNEVCEEYNFKVNSFDYVYSYGEYIFNLDNLTEEFLVSPDRFSVYYSGNNIIFSFLYDKNNYQDLVDDNFNLYNSCPLIRGVANETKK